MNRAIKWTGIAVAVLADARGVQTLINAWDGRFSNRDLLVSLGIWAVGCGLIFLGGFREIDQEIRRNKVELG